MKKTSRVSIYPLIMGVLAMLTISCKKDVDNDTSTTVKDIDGNVYHTVTIGSQVWMVENLRTTKYNDGSTIPVVTDNNAWVNLKTPAYCWYDNDEPTNKSQYGALYNLYAVKTGKLCPTGWHVPTDADWTQLTNFLGGESVAGGKLKETGTTHWNIPNTGATNESGFTALPGGIRDYDGTFDNIGRIGYWWSATSNFPNPAMDRHIEYNYIDVGRDGALDDYDVGLSVRCIKD